MNFNLCSKSPLRLGLAGGGTDLPNVVNTIGGTVLNATINLYTYCVAREGSFQVTSLDYGRTYYKNDIEEFSIFANCIKLLEIKYNKLLPDLEYTTWSESPPGSGLGSSSSLVVSILNLFYYICDIENSKKILAEDAWYVERIMCKMQGGLQDQFSAAFGGINLFHFIKDDVIIEEIQPSKNFISRYESSTLLFYTGKSRSSDYIIQNQINISSLTSYEKLKRFASDSSKLIQSNNFTELMQIFNSAWIEKKKTSDKITNDFIENIISDISTHFDILNIKISGAGGGGFMVINANPEVIVKIENYLKSLEFGRTFRISLEFTGSHVIKIN